MKTIGEKIAELRKEKGLTQNALADIIGVTSQTISKWETNNTMPDIMLLPVIADIFGVAIDELLSEKSLQTNRILYEETPAAVYDEILKNMWQEKDKDYVLNLREALSNGSDMNSGFVSETAGCVYANHDLALAFLPDKCSAATLLDSDEAAEFLIFLADKTVRAIMKYQAKAPGEYFTCASVANKIGISEDVVKKALERLASYRFVNCSQIKSGTDEIINVYQINGAYKMMLLVYPLFSLADTLSNFSDNWFGLRG